MHVTTSAETPLPVKKLLIADDHRLARAGSSAQRESGPDPAVVAEGEKGQRRL
jgi:hypothetical protein